LTSQLLVFCAMCIRSTANQLTSMPWRLCMSL
jgi:hypothetical protein